MKTTTKTVRASCNAYGTGINEKAFDSKLCATTLEALKNLAEKMSSFEKSSGKRIRTASLSMGRKSGGEVGLEKALTEEARLLANVVWDESKIHIIVSHGIS